MIRIFRASDFSLFAPLVGMMAGGRKLNPSRKDRRKIAITLGEAVDREVQVMLSIQHASNVPFRATADNQALEEEEDYDDFGELILLETFCSLFLCTNRTVSSVFHLPGDSI